MTAPLARIVHCSKGRMRLRIPARRDDSGYFEKLAAGLAKAPGVTHVRTNPATAGVLLLYTGESPVAHAVAKGLLHVEDNGEPEAGPTDPLAPVAAAYGRMEERFRDTFGGGVSIATLAVVALLVNALLQVLRGRLTPVSWHSSLWYAINLALLLKTINKVDRKDR